MDGTELATISLFAELDESSRDRLASVCSGVEVDAGTTLVHEGDFGFAMFASGAQSELMRARPAVGAIRQS